MPLITRESLDLNNFSFYTDWTAISRGRIYHAEKRVSIATFSGETANCRVAGVNGNYTVIITAESKNRVSFSCTCPQAVKVHTCKHMIASALAVQEFLKNVAENTWQYRVALALDNIPRRGKQAARREKFMLLYGLLRDKYASGEMYFRLIPYKLKLKDWHPDGLQDILLDVEKINQLLDADRSWTESMMAISSAQEIYACANLPPDSVQLCNLIIREDQGRYYGQYGTQHFATYLPLLARQNVPLFSVNNRGTYKDRLFLLTEPVSIQAALAREGDNLSLQAGLLLGGKVFTTVKENLFILSKDPPWVLAGHYLVPVENPESLEFMGYFPMTIPKKEEHIFREQYFRYIAERIPVVGDVISWQDVTQPPVARIYLSDNEHAIRASLQFGYGEYEVAADPRATTPTLFDITDSWGMVRLHRQLSEENRFYQMLTDARFGLKRAGREIGPGEFELRSRTHPFDFLLYSVPLLAKAGFEILGEDKLKTSRINRATPRISLSVSSGLDWFELKATVHYGDQEVPLHDIRKAVRKREHYIKLADGSVGQIPEAWLERYRHLFDMAEETSTGLKVADYHIPLVDTLLADAEITQAPADFQVRRERLRSFEHITPVPVPQGFTGELRPYQKAGLDWLHFLQDYGFGGCLADDMGLGKTIQVLAFLQSMKERATSLPGTLLVVPKSLIANWVRETARFTPGLRILEYYGGTRAKDTQSFAGYDMILTTYGTMLRDIELLRSYRFNYVILDESQAIKNPLSQSAKAARLLKAHRRLVMTGTPVENNTFELWSQFAFLNPGLLGGMDYFKREFANPIEGRSDDTTAATLRRLVYPFILRRTKEQVAPELPPRTERIIYTDMEPSQRRVYTHTRERYRTELMGLIASDGMANARMKILEGLLRLRQICIHPVLVDKSYHGSAAKIDLLFETLDTLQAEGHKALIFSQFVETLKIVRQEMDERKMTYTYLDGQTQNRQDVVDRFQNDPAISFFLISLKAGGVGLNLTAADYVIHLDPWWNPAVEMQAADRAHRIGQDKPVFVYKYIVRDSVEEKILQLQERKKDLVEQLISADGSVFKSMTAEDVKALFS